MTTRTPHSESTPLPDRRREPASAANIAEQLREHTWTLSERWLMDVAEHVSERADVDTDELTRFGEIPSIIAAIAHHLDSHNPFGAERELFSRTTIDSLLHDTATAHVTQRISQNYTHRDLLVEFAALRHVLNSFFLRFNTPITMAAMRAIDGIFDEVIIDTADQFHTQVTAALTVQAERDPLTGLFNRRAFLKHFSDELLRAERYGHALTLVSADIDAFKEVNDELGHLTGDALLQRIGDLLLTHTREQDIVGRLGGDEFAVVLVEAGPDTALDLIRRLRIHLTPARRKLNLPVRFGISFGSATYPAQGTTIEDLMTAADRRMYRDKGPGRGAAVQKEGVVPEVSALRTLIVDDEAGLRTLCDSVLQANGFETVQAGSGAEALDILRGDEQFDAVLLDIGMPEMTGWEVLNQIRRNPDFEDLPVIMLTARADDRHFTRAATAGATAYVVKPFTSNELVQTLHDVVEQASPQGTR